MKLVSQQSDRDIAIKRAEEGVGDHLRKLAANLMRCTRGAGKPYNIEIDIGELADAFTSYRQATGHGVPTQLVHSHLDLERHKASCWTDNPALPGYGLDHRRRENAEEMMIRGALQIAASRMAGQPLQESRGEDEMLDGARNREETVAVSKPTKKGGRKPLQW